MTKFKNSKCLSNMKLFTQVNGLIDLQLMSSIITCFRINPPTSQQTLNHTHLNQYSSSQNHISTVSDAAQPQQALISLANQLPISRNSKRGRDLQSVSGWGQKHTFTTLNWYSATKYTYFGTIQANKKDHKILTIPLQIAAKHDKMYAKMRQLQQFQRNRKIQNKQAQLFNYKLQYETPKLENDLIDYVKGKKIHGVRRQIKPIKIVKIRNQISNNFIIKKLKNIRNFSKQRTSISTSKANMLETIIYPTYTKTFHQTSKPKESSKFQLINKYLHP